MAVIKTTAQQGTQWTFTLNANGKYPLIDNRIFEYKSDIEAYITSATSNACAGIILRVLKDTTANNGAYLVVYKDQTDPTKGLALKKIGDDVNLDITSVTFTTDAEAQEATGDPSATAGTYLKVKKADGSGYTYSKISIDLSSYATQAWVDQQGFLKSATDHQYKLVESGSTAETKKYQLQTSTNGSSWSDVSGSVVEISLKDMVVSGGTIVDITKSGSSYFDGGVDVTSKVSHEGKHLKLTISGSSDVVYIYVKDLVDVYTADNTTIQLTGSQFSAKTSTFNTSTGAISNGTALVTGNLLKDYVDYRLGWEIIGV